MSHSRQIEIERKYDVEEAPTVPDLVGAGTIAVIDVPEIIELDALYYDTDEFDLAHNRTALRRRSGGSDAGWHIKSAEPGDEGRTELHWPLASDGDQTDAATPSTVPAGVREQVEHLVSGRALHPVARVRNRRENRRLLDAAGYPVAELSDDHVNAENLMDGSVRSWREWEVELLAAAPDTRSKRTELLDTIEGILLAAGATPSTSSSKLARALGIDSRA